MKIDYFPDEDGLLIDFELKHQVGELRYIEPKDGAVLIWVDEAGDIATVEIMSGASGYDMTRAADLGLVVRHEE